MGSKAVQSPKSQHILYLHLYFFEFSKQISRDENDALFALKMHRSTTEEEFCCDMGQNDTIGKIELKIIFRLAVGISNSRNDIQLFLQLFDELRVNGDYH